MNTKTYVVERYLPGLSANDILAAGPRINAVLAEMAREGTAITYVGSTFVPGDEACFCEFQGPSAEAVVEANERAALPFARVLPAVRVAAEPVEEEQT